MADHISADLLELYVMGRAPEADIPRIEEHLLICETCRELFSDTAMCVATLRMGLRQMTGLVAIHATRDGVVTLHVKKSRKDWVGRVQGPDIDSGEKAPNERAALRACQDAFRSMYPEHECSAGCKLFVP